ncbi:MAG TPA: nitroreductase family deazaflavin-dependent oxidoreductase [Kineosporiaceae bacterium]|nr:nitroreductase family deazaflavin-dependent oxidoreductase [Kineosporiaceae bacterium]
MTGSSPTRPGARPFPWLTPRTLLARVHTRIYRWSGGRVGSRFGSLEQILLTTVGRRTGQPRTTPLAAIPEGDALVLVASNWGQGHHPAWLHNLVAQPEVVVQRGPRSQPMQARVADDQERERLWPLVVRANPGFEDYARTAGRTIPVVICEPAPAG